MLWGLLIQAMNGTRSDAPRPLRETGFGLIFMLARLIAGQLYEARKIIDSRSTAEVFALLDASDSGATAMIERANTARACLGKRFGQRALLAEVRNKLSFHSDRGLMDKAFEDMPDDVSLADFHTPVRGTTFFGTSDTVTSFALCQLTNTESVIAGATALMNEIQAAMNDLSDFIHGYNLAFTLAHIGRQALNDSETITLRDMPRADNSKLRFFLYTDGLKRKFTVSPE